MVAMAFSPITSSLAVARDNGDIELWTVPDGPPHCYLRIPGRKSLAIKALVWAVHEEEDENSSDDESESGAENEKPQNPAKKARVQSSPTERQQKERLFSAGTMFFFLQRCTFSHLIICTCLSSCSFDTQHLFLFQEYSLTCVSL